MPHDHAYVPGALPDLGPAFRWAVGLNAGYVIVEGVAGFLTGSLALIADAAHNLTDVAGLAIAWIAMSLGRRPDTARHNWGLGRATILAALFNAVAILIGIGAVIWEAIDRLAEPVAVPGGVVLVVALVGIVVNTGSALLFLGARERDLNARGAYLHMAADAAVSVAVVAAAGGILLTGWHWLDPAVAIGVSLVIAITAARLMREALHLSLDGVPFDIDAGAVAAWLRDQQGVEDVHDLRIWGLSTTRTALAAHVVRAEGDPDRFIRTMSEELARRFGIDTIILQLERTSCAVPASGREGASDRPAVQARA